MNKTKRSLLTSALSLLLCCAMLVGTTLAWFTDSVTSANNIIKAGDLTVTFEWLEGTKDVPADDADEWKDASTDVIFNNDLWEPGYTEVRHIKIANEGTVALKYQLYFNAEGEVSDLTDAIDVYYVDPAVKVENRTDLTDDMKIGTLTEVLAGMKTTANGNLLAGHSTTATIALKMRETAGNEYQGKAIGDSFNLVLTATQYNHEEDSFGDDYDEGLAAPDEDGDIKAVINGVTYYYRANGSLLLSSVPSTYAEDTLYVEDGTTTIGGWAFSSAANLDKVVFSSTVTTVNKNAFKDAAVKEVVLNEGLTEIGLQAFNGAKQLAAVNFPTTLTTVGFNAFRQTAIETLTLPANVTTLAEGAFRDMPNLTTVTIDGNVEIGNFAFRSCPSLTTVYLNGDDVTFAGTSMVFTHADTGDANGITIYVQNETVKERLIAASGSAYGYEVIVAE